MRCVARVTCLVFLICQLLHCVIFIFILNMFDKINISYFLIYIYLLTYLITYLLTYTYLLALLACLLTYLLIYLLTYLLTYILRNPPMKAKYSTYIYSPCRPTLYLAPPVYIYAVYYRIASTVLPGLWEPNYTPCLCVCSSQLTSNAAVRLATRVDGNRLRVDVCQV